MSLHLAILTFFFIKCATSEAVFLEQFCMNSVYL